MRPRPHATAATTALLTLALAAVALAGCADQGGDDLGDDAAGGSTGAGLDGQGEGEASAGTITVGPSPPVDPQPRPGHVPPGVTLTVGEPLGPSMTEEVHLELAAGRDGGLAKVTAVAHHVGDRTLYYSGGHCGVPWNDELTGPPGLVQRRVSAMACGEVDYKEWTPGTALVATWHWNGTQAVPGDDGESRQQPAPAGDYTWTITFAVSGCASSECNLATLSASVPVTVRSG